MSTISNHVGTNTDQVKVDRPGPFFGATKQRRSNSMASHLIVNDQRSYFCMLLSNQCWGITRDLQPSLHLAMHGLCDKQSDRHLRRNQPEALADFFGRTWMIFPAAPL